MVDWFIELDNQHNVLKNSSSIADLGPQDLSGGLSFPEQEKIKDGVSLYAKLGITKYISFDLFDSRAEKVDLNLDLKRTDKWDIVTNFGTSEHVFNQQAIFKNCHDLTKTGGISLHCLPVSSGMDHGFFNYHPTFFRSLATELWSMMFLSKYMRVSFSRCLVHLAVARQRHCE